MKIQRHRNGTFSLTDLTRFDLDNLAFGAGVAESWYFDARNAVASGTTPDNEWFVGRRGIFSRLATYLRRVSETRSPVTVTVRSDDAGATALAIYERVTAESRPRNPMACSRCGWTVGHAPACEVTA